MKQAMDFERDPIYFKKLHDEPNDEFSRKIKAAQKLLPRVRIKEKFLRIVARMCIELDVDGHRPDIIITRAAMTKAAYDGRTAVSEEDMVFASELTLGFRMRRNPFEEASLGASKFQQVLDQAKKLEAESEKKKRQAQAKKTYLQIAKVAKQFLGLTVYYAGSILFDPNLVSAVRSRTPVMEAYPRSQASAAIRMLASRLSRSSPSGEIRRPFFRKVVNWFS